MKNLLIALLCAAPAFAAWPNGYTYKTSFTVNASKVPSMQSNFPALISQTVTDWATAPTGQIQHTCTQTVGSYSLTIPADLIFTSDSAGSLPLAGWEFESYTAATGAMIVWLNVPSIANGTVVYAWYGNASVSTCQATPSATWNTAYKGVWHFPNGTTIYPNDSTTQGNHCTLEGSPAASSTFIDGGVTFVGANSQDCTVATPTGVDFATNFSLEMWIKPSTVNAEQTIIGKPYGFNTAQYAVDVTSAGKIGLYLFALTPYPVVASTSTLTAGTPYHVVATYTTFSNTGAIYINGAPQGSSAATSGTYGACAGTCTAETAYRLTIGSFYESVYDPTHGQFYNGSVDEVRISSTALRADWITAEYNNQSAPGSFWTVVTGQTYGPSQGGGYLILQ